MTEIVAFASSRQPRDGSESGGSGSGASVSTEKAVPVSKRKSADWPPRLLILGVPQVLLGQGLAWGPPDIFSPDCPENLTPGAYTSEGSLFSSVVLYRPDM